MLMYFITTVSKDDNRCVGFYRSWFKAVKAVEENSEQKEDEKVNKSVDFFCFIL